MQHLDEGTIHAWLDGELPLAEGEAAEAHVASCDECKAAVAEARGFIAASSRILMALDAAPGGVLPAAQELSVPAKKRAPARFRVSRAWMAAAAVLVLSTATVIAIRPRGDSAALRVAEMGKEQKATAVAPSVSRAMVDSGPVGATAPVTPNEKSEMTAPAPNAPARKPADALAERLQKSTDKASARTAAAQTGGAMAAEAAPPVARPLALNSVVVSGAGIATSNTKLTGMIPFDSIAPQLVSRSTSNAGRDTIVTTVYSVRGVPVSLIDRSSGSDELRRQAEVSFSDQPAAKSRERDVALRMNSLTWSDSAGRTRTLRGAVSRADLERLKAALFGPTP